MMPRIVEPEWLDQLPPDDPRATASRADLRRIHRIMGHAPIISRSFLRHHTASARHQRHQRRLRIADLGGGDGTLLLRLAQQWRAQGIVAEVDLLDARPAVAPQTAAAYCQLGWAIHVTTIDALQWARSRGSSQTPPPPPSIETSPDKSPPQYDLILSTLFLHHFKHEALSALLAGIASSTTLFIACEPHRSALSLWAARALPLIGATATTLHDAKTSVRAGFAGKELSRLWAQTPHASAWHLVERRSLFSHTFIATHR